MLSISKAAYLALPLSFPCVLAIDPIECVNGIRTAVAEFQFFNTTPGDYWGTLCTNDLSLHSMWAAAKVYCTLEEIAAGERELAAYCIEDGGYQLTPYATILPDLTDDYISHMEIVSYTDINATKIWNNSVLVSKDFEHMAVMTTWIFDYEYILHNRYGWALYGFWGGILVTGIINKLCTHTYNARLARRAVDVERLSPLRKRRSSVPGALSFLLSAYQWSRTNLIIPSSVGARQKQLLHYVSIPTRLEGLVILVYYVLNIILCGVSYYVFWPNLYYSVAEQRWRYIADRCGIMSYANIPWLWLFSGRNNIFLWATGWSFATFNRFHRHIARIATVQGIIHSAAWSALETGYLSEMWKETYWYMGGIGCVTMSLLLVFSSVFLRRKSYEAFLIIHILLSVVTLVALYYHTHLSVDAYSPYLYPPMAIWGIDRALRILRQVYCNLHVKLSGSVAGTESTAHYDTETNVIRLEVIPGSRILSPQSGQHYFIYQPLRWRGWENHPFTLASWSELGSSDIDAEVTARHGDLTKHPIGSVSCLASEPQTMNNNGKHKLVFYIRPFEGWTKKVRDQCIKSPTGSINPRILIEGPYGQHHPLQTYENVVFFVGGTGISGALPYLQDHLRVNHSHSLANGSTQESSIHEITFVWAAKESGLIQDICSRELQPVLSCDNIHASFHCTSLQKTTTAPEIELKFGENKLKVSRNRPDVGIILADVVNVVQSAGHAGGRIAVLCCGPASMAADVRFAVYKALKNGKREIDYFEEVFSW